MSFKAKLVKVGVVEEYYAVTCPYCGMSFVLFYLKEPSEDSYEEYGELWAQERVSYCPYCGKSTEGDN